MERRGKKLLGPGAVVAISDIERGPSATAALPENDNTWPSDGDGADARGERGVGVSIGEKREGKKLLWT